MAAQKKKRAYDSLATRKRILDAAADTFQRQGYHATSMQELLAAADVPGGSMYHCFPTKKELGLAVIRERVLPAVHETWVDPLKNARAVDKVILGVFRDVAAGIDRRGSVLGCPVTNLAVELAGVDRDFQAALEEAYSAWENAIRERLANDALATLVVSAFAGAMSLAKTENSSRPLTQCARQLAPLLK